MVKRTEHPDVVGSRLCAGIGLAKLLEKIGEGGFGVVFMAEQVVPVQRKVALKIIKAGMDTREVIARFEAERQAIALMDHPNIARALDAGATEAGRPYFVMELVRGIQITDYCDQANLPTQERLQLFMKVCQAVQHAHQKGVIHRDLKPSNVLVTEHDGEPVPKVIDFGVAKALGHKLTEKTLFTGFQHMIGTPAYMSPEQAALSGLAPLGSSRHRKRSCSMLTEISSAFITPGRPGKSNSGSKVVGARISSAASPNANSIPLLLLRAAAAEGPGIFARTTYIQRVNTVGGIALSGPGTSIGEQARIPYTAEYFFYRRQQ